MEPALHGLGALPSGGRRDGIGGPMQHPTSEVELMHRADALAGRSLADIAGEHAWAVPPDLKRHKGWIGDLVERGLGVQGAGYAGPDIPELGVEIKTIPVDERGKPRESSWVCKAPMERLALGSWMDSPVRKKLARVLWVPVLGEGAPAGRRIGAPLLWSPSAEQEELLAEDWHLLAELIGEGEVWQWKAHHGKALQVRPKAARGDDWVWVLDTEGEWVRTSPLGFYLRARFTAGVLAEEWRLLAP